MSIRSFIRKIAGRTGKASRSNRGANSHVNTQANKRAASKAVRQPGFIFYDELLDYHLDMPDEIKERYDNE